MRQVLVDRAELFIAHSSDRLPRHLVAEFMAVGVDAGAHRGDELLKLPSPHKIEVGPERPELPWHAAGQLRAMARAAILIRQDIFAIQQSGTRGRRRDGTDGYRVSHRQHAGAQHHDTQQVEVIGRIVGWLSACREAADIGDNGAHILVAQFSGIRVGHDDQPAAVRVDAVANGSKDIAIRPAAQWPGGCQIGGYERPDRYRKVLADLQASCEYAGLSVASAAEAVRDRFAALNLLRCARYSCDRSRGCAGIQLEQPDDHDQAYQAGDGRQ